MGNEVTETNVRIIIHYDKWSGVTEPSCDICGELFDISTELVVSLRLHSFTVNLHRDCVALLTEGLRHFVAETEEAVELVN